MTNNERVSRWRAANRDRVRQQSAERWKNDPKYRERQQARRKQPNYRAKEREYQKAERRDALRWPTANMREVRRRAASEGIVCTITAADIPVPNVCPIFGVPFVFGGNAHPYGPTVDRLDPAGGYVPGNVNVISRRANTIKNDCTDPAVFRRIAEWLEQQATKGST